MSESFALLIFFLHLLFSAFLLTLKTGKPLSNRLLAAFLLITAIDISNFIFYGFYQSHLNLDMMRANIASLIAPTLYFFVKTILVENFSFKRKDLFHLLPYVLVSLLFVPRFHLGDEVAKWAFYNNQAPMLEIVVTHIVTYTQLVSYLIAIFLMLRRYQHTIENHYSDLSALNKNWLFTFMFLFLADFVVVSIRNFFKFTVWEAQLSFLTPLMLFCTLAFVCWIVWHALHTPEIFRGVEERKITEVGETDRLEKPRQNDIDSYESQQIIHALEKHMDAHHTYLEANITIDKLAELIEVDAQQLSLALNRYLNVHFFDYINKQRVEAAARFLSEPNSDKKTILEILYDVGFNSKSSFNTAFKKHKGMTPSQFRKNHQLAS